MGRPKQYASPADKHRAYRARLSARSVRVDRQAWAALEGRANRLAEAVCAARLAGCPIAVAVGGIATDTILERLADWFEAQARAGKEGR